MAKKSRTPPPWVTAYKDDITRLWRTEGRDVWKRLGKGLISAREQSWVAADPDLEDETLARMVDERGGESNLQRIEFYFENPSPEDTYDKAKDIGFAALSFCIKQDRNATWADIVARYALLRRTPFLETALFLRERHNKYGLFYFDEKTQRPTRWSPSISRKRTVSIKDEWGDLISMQSETKRS